MGQTERPRENASTAFFCGRLYGVYATRLSARSHVEPSGRSAALCATPDVGDVVAAGETRGSVEVETFDLRFLTL